MWHIEPAAGGSVGNIQSVNSWGLGMKYPALLNGGGGGIARVQLLNSQYINAGTPNYITSGSVANFQHLNDIFN
jgi:hypothetical protein